MKQMTDHDIIGVKATALLREHDAFRVPVQVDIVAARLGIRLDSALLEDSISGVLVIQNGRATIGYNSSHAVVRQRFTIAHEIGHYQLHQGDSETEDVFIDTGRQVSVFLRDQESATGEQKREIEANLFAACLLMPDDLLRAEIIKPEYVVLHDEKLSEQLAAKFQVSTQAMSIRLSRLGLL